MNLEITKSDFEKAVPAAREPKGKIFEVMEDAIMAKVEQIGDSLLGEPGIAAVEDSENTLHDYLRSAVKRLACVSAFLEEMRGLDLVLTATGFGVVSTQDTAPASKMRVDSPRWGASSQGATVAQSVGASVVQSRRVERHRAASSQRGNSVLPLRYAGTLCRHQPS